VTGFCSNSLISLPSRRPLAPSSSSSPSSSSASSLVPPPALPASSPAMVLALLRGRLAPPPGDPPVRISVLLLPPAPPLPARPALLGLRRERRLLPDFSWGVDTAAARQVSLKIPPAMATAAAAALAASSEATAVPACATARAKRTALRRAAWAGHRRVARGALVVVWEGTGGVAAEVEMLAYGVPEVATKAGVNPEVRVLAVASGSGVAAPDALVEAATAATAAVGAAIVGSGV